MIGKGQELSRLNKRLGYVFNNLKLLEEALTHRSVRGDNNERLEFLGDSLLNFIITNELFLQYPYAKEGELSRTRANMVNGEVLAKIAKQLELGQFMRLGVGELKSGGFTRKSILADALEAIIGAIYLDADFMQCRDRVLAWYQTCNINFSSVTAKKDAKTLLQEYLQAKHLPLPVYMVTKMIGDTHEQIFYIRCQVKGLPYVSDGHGDSRRKAEQEAAHQFLELLKVS